MLIAFNGQRLRRVKNCTPKSMQRGPECALVAVPLPACPCHTSLCLCCHWQFIFILFRLCCHCGRCCCCFCCWKSSGPKISASKCFPLQNTTICVCVCLCVRCSVPVVLFSVFAMRHMQPAFAGIRKLLPKSFANANLRLPLTAK